jgi:hypothetical protein
VWSIIAVSSSIRSAPFVGRYFAATRAGQANFRCLPAAGFFAAVSFACFLPAIGISISF